MAKSQRTHQEQSNVQIQKLAPHQLMLVSLIELPVAGLEERVKKELYENDALEEGIAANEYKEENYPEEATGETVQSLNSPDEISDKMDDDELPVYSSSSSPRSIICDNATISGSDSLIDDLIQQISEYDLSPHQQSLLSYLIGSLNDNGFVDRELYILADELAFCENIDTDEEELLQMLHILQDFDPPGIGARNLRECLLIQIDRLIRSTKQEDLARLELLRLQRQIVDEYHSSLVNNNMERLYQKLNVSPERVDAAIEGIKKLNPRPGMALSESNSERAQTIIPDFIVETDSDGNISLTLNGGYVPPVKINELYEQEVKKNQDRIQDMNPRERDAYIYRKQKVDAARMFVDSLTQRKNTLYATMKAIISLQKEFFLTQDELKMKSMTLKDVATLTKLDESTISRVKNYKYVSVDGHVYPLDYFFPRARTNAKGEVVVGYQVMQMLQEIIDSEDKNNPYSDEQLVELLNKKGQDIKHRTVTKYRNQMGIPTARLRKKV